MSQDHIIKIMEKHDYLLSSEIIEIIQNRTNSDCQNVKRVLKQMRKYNDLSFVVVTKENFHELAKIYPKLQIKIESGYKITRPQYLYINKFINNGSYK